MRNCQVHPGDWIRNQAIGCPNLGDPVLYQATESDRNLFRLNPVDCIRIQATGSANSGFYKTEAALIFLSLLSFLSHFSPSLLGFRSKITTKHPPNFQSLSIILKSLTFQNPQFKTLTLSIQK
jgi:hypothetical protein